MPVSNKIPKKILFQVSASIAAYKACHAISRLVQDGHDVQIITSPNLPQFIGPATLEGLTQRPILTQNFESGRMMDHIHLARWCDLAILCPASANQINKLAAGIADDLIGTLFLAYEFKKKPYLLAPAMNVEMFNNPLTQKSLKTLQEIGVVVLTSPSGSLACGEYGQGRLMEPEEILSEIRRVLESPPHVQTGKKVLLTSGGTRESIDGVRFITNLSSGKTGKIVAEELMNAGYNVTHLHPGDEAEASHKFTDFLDLDKKMREHLAHEKYDWVIHMAAVSDFSVKEAKSGGKKIDLHSKLVSSENLFLELKPNHKIINRLVQYSKNKKVNVIGFKFTNTQDPKLQITAIKKLFKNPGVQFVVHTDLSGFSSESAGEKKHRFIVYEANMKKTECEGKSQLARTLVGVLSGDFR